MMRRAGRGALAAAISVLLALPAAADPKLTVTSPADGATVSLGATPELAVAGGVTFDVPAPTTQKYYMRRKACGGSAEQATRLSIKRGADGGDGCGNLIPGVFYEITGGRPTTSYPADDGVPFTLDATKNITGVVAMTGFVGRGAGSVTMDVTLTGTASTGDFTIGSTTVTEQIDPLTSEQEVEWSVIPDASLDKQDFSFFNLDLVLRGANALYGFVRLNGRSHLTLATYTASFDRRVEMAVDSGGFGSAGITLSEDLKSWSGTIPTPPIGSHLVHARAVQGGKVSPVISRTIHVTA